MKLPFALKCVFVGAVLTSNSFVLAAPADASTAMQSSLDNLQADVADIVNKGTGVAAGALYDTTEAAIAAVENDLKAIIYGVRNAKGINDKYMMIRNRLNDVVKTLSRVTELPAGVLVVQVNELRTALSNLHASLDGHEDAQLLVRKLMAKLSRFSRTYAGAVAVSASVHGKELYAITSAMADKVRKDETTYQVVKDIGAKLMNFVATFDKVVAAEGQRTFSRIRADLNIIQNKLSIENNPKLERKLALIKNRTVDFGDTLIHVTEVSSVTTMNGMAMSLLDITRNDASHEEMNEVVSDFIGAFADITSRTTTSTGHSIVNDMEDMLAEVRGDTELFDRMNSVRENFKHLAHEYVELAMEIGNKATNELLRDTVAAIKSLRSNPLLEKEMTEMQVTVENFLNQMNEVSMMTTMTAGRSLSRDMASLNSILPPSHPSRSILIRVEDLLSEIVSEYSTAVSSKTITFSDFFMASKDASGPMGQAWVVDGVSLAGQNRAAARELYNFYDSDGDGKLTSEDIDQSIHNPSMMNEVAAITVGAATGLAGLLLLAFTYLALRFLYNKYANKDSGYNNNLGENVKWSTVPSKDLDGGMGYGAAREGEVV